MENSFSWHMQDQNEDLWEALQVYVCTYAFLTLYLFSMPQELSFDMYINEAWALK